ncbi:MAG: hypothetical protein IPQ07_00645 [Myxococcales bacterium]|nr:hypothetical protein [Myxococcales bacterium]
MNKLLALALSLPLFACTVGSDQGAGGGGGGGGGGGTPDAGGGGGGAAGHITTSTTWTGTMDLTASTTIDPGVTVTVMPGTKINLASGASLTVGGILDAQGTKASVITIGAATAGQFHSGLSIPTGGEVRFAYVVQTGGGIMTSGGKATIVDSLMSKASGDFLVMSGGNIDISYSQIGLAEGATGDTTHCDMHFGGTGNTIKVTHSNIGTTPYGLMFYAGTGAIFTNNNWYGNQTDVDVTPGSGVVGDFTGSWFDGAAPVAKAGTTLNGLAALSTTKLVDAGPR